MKQWKRLSVVAVMSAMFFAMPVKANAADFPIQVVFEDSLYGGAIGALVGAGMTMLSSKPSDNLDYISKGAGVGIIAGAVYGVFTMSRALASIEGNRMVVALPTPVVTKRNHAGGDELALEAELLAVHF